MSDSNFTSFDKQFLLRARPPVVRSRTAPRQDEPPITAERQAALNREANAWANKAERRGRPGGLNRDSRRVLPVQKKAHEALVTELVFRIYLKQNVEGCSSRKKHRPLRILVATA